MKRLAWIALAVFASLLLAWWLARPADQQSAQAQELFLPEVALHINAVDHLVVDGAGDARIVELRRGESGWQLAGEAGYPAAMEPVRQLLGELAKTRLRERKTADAAFHERLGVQDVSDPNAPGVRLRLDAGDQSWTIILGETSPSGNGRYARLADQDQVWELDRSLDVGVDRADWMVRELLDLDPAGVRLMAVTHADGEQLLLRPDESGDFTLSRFGPGETLGQQYLANQMPAALASLRLSDARPATEVDWTGAVEVAVTLDDGAGVRTRWQSGSDEAEDAWVQVVELWAAEPAMLDEAAGITDSTTGTEDSQELPLDAVEDAPADETADEEPVDNTPEWQQSLQQRGLGWAYQVPAYRMEQLIKRRAELLAADEAGTDEP